MVKVVVIKARRSGPSNDQKSNDRLTPRKTRAPAAESLIDQVFRNFPKIATTNENGPSPSEA